MTPLRKAARALVLQESGEDGFDALSEELQAQVIESVKAVAEAFREPSAQMAETGIAWLRGERDEKQTVLDIWRAMTDALIESE